MGRKMKFPAFLSNAKNNNNNSLFQGKSSWPPWPSCHQPRTFSFRTEHDNDHNNNNTTTMFKTINSSADFDAIIEAADETPESWFSNSSESASFSTAASDDCGLGAAAAAADPIETVIRGLRSDRLFFEPGRETSSILEVAKPGHINDDDIDDGLPFKESVVLSMVSQDPFVDFRKSMEEMVEAHGLKDWENLEQLLCWYLTANGKCNHGFIVGAFVDLLVGLAISSTNNRIASCSNCSHSPSSPLSFYTSSSSSSSSSSSECSSSTTTPCVSPLEVEQEIDNGHCLASVSEADDQKEIIIKDDDASSSSLDI